MRTSSADGSKQMARHLDDRRERWALRHEEEGMDETVKERETVDAERMPVIVWQVAGETWINVAALRAHLNGLVEHAEMTRNAQMCATVQESLDWLQEHGA